MKKTQKNQYVKKDKLISLIKTMVLSIATGMFGFAIGWLFEGKILLSLLVLSILAIVSLVAWVFTVIYEKKISVLEMLNNDIKQEKYQEAVKLGYSISRALFLSGKNHERYRISEKVREALNKLDGSIVINEKSENVHLLKAKLLIDDCGWSLYLLNRFENKKSAESRIREGINECLRFSSMQETETFSIVFKALRHLLGMVIENFEEVSTVDLESNSIVLDNYIEELDKYGKIFAYLLNDPKMSNGINEDEQRVLFKEISINAQNSDEYLIRLKKWCQESLNDPKFMLSTYNFRAKYFLCLYKAYQVKNSATQRISLHDCLQSAKCLAIKMTLGYAKSNNDFEWLLETVSFSNETEKYKDSYSFIKPDHDRFVKSYVLVGTIAMITNDLQSLEDAKTAFIKAVSYSKVVNRTDTYVSAQRKLISVNERIFNLKLELNYFDKEDALEAIQNQLDLMERIIKETNSYLGHSDEKMEKSCKERKKHFFELQKKIKADIIKP